MKSVLITILMFGNITLFSQTLDSTICILPADSSLLGYNVYDAPYSLDAYGPDKYALLQNTGIFLGGSVGVVGILYLMPETVTSWNKKSFTFNNIFAKWKNNVSTGPVFDKDKWNMNWIAHPYFGAIYYTSARSLGHSSLNSFLYSATMSTFAWEYGLEAFAEVPSTQDLIITPVVGSIVGELFFLAKREIIQNEYEVLNSKFLGHLISFLLDPVNEFNNFIFRRSYFNN